VLRVDQPPQNYMTNVIRNTVNPMWDEQFVMYVRHYSTCSELIKLDLIVDV